MSPLHSGTKIFRIPEDPDVWQETMRQGYLTYLSHLTLPMVHDTISESHRDTYSLIGSDRTGMHSSKWSLGNGLLLNLWTIVATSRLNRVLCSTETLRNLRTIHGHGHGRIEPLGKGGTS
jgi:hypothetical protein